MTAPGTTTIIVNVRLNDYLSIPAQRAAAATDQLREEIKKLNRVLLLLDKRLDRVNRTLIQYAANMYLAAAATQFFNRQVQNLNFNLNITNNHLNNINRSSSHFSQRLNQMNSSMSRSNRTIFQFRANLGRLGKMTTSITKLMKLMAISFAAVGAIGAAGQAVQQVLVLISVLQTLVAFAGLVPIALLSVVGVIATLLLAFKGFGAGLQALGASQSEFNEAIKKLAPAAQQVLKALRPFVPEFKKLKKEVQQAFFAPIAAYVKGMVTNLLPVMRAGFADTAGALGRAFASIVQFFNTSKGVEFFSSMFRGAQEFADLLDRILFPLLVGITDMSTAALPAWHRLMNALGDGLQNFSTWMSEISASGQLDGMLNEAFAVAKMLWGVLSSIMGIFGDIIAAATNAGGLGIEVLLDDLRAFTSSDAGQSAMTSIFVAFGDIARALVPIIGALSTVIGATLAPAIGPIVEHFGPALVTIIGAIGTALEVVMPYWGPLAAAIAGLVVAFAPLIAALGPIVAIIGTLLTAALQFLITMLTPVITVVTHFVEVFGGMFMTMLSALMPILNDMFTQFGMILMQLTPLLMTVITMMADAFAPILGEIVIIAAQLAPMLLELAQVFAGALIMAFQLIQPYLPQIFEGIANIWMAVLQLIPALAPMISMWTQVIVAIMPFIPLAAQIIGWMLNIAAGAMNLLAVLIGWSVSVIGALASVLNWVVTSWNRITSALTGPFETARGIISNIIGGIAGMIQGLASKIEGIMSKIGGLNPFRAFGGPVDANTKYNVGELGREMFVPNVGKPYLIGKNGMEERTFSTAGTVIPSFMLDAMESANAQAVRDAKALLNQDAGASSHVQTMAARRATEAAATEHTWNLNFAGASFSSDIDVEKAVEKGVDKAMRKWNQQRKERA